jgi:hypothetical protein
MEVAMQLGLLAKGGQHYVDGPLWIPAAVFIGLCVLPLLIRAIRRRSQRAQAEETPGWYPDHEGRP